MGNNIAKTVRCEAQSDPTILPPPPPMGTPTSSVGGDQAQMSPPGGPPINERFRNNPGTMDDFHKRVKDIFPMPIEGMRIIISRQLSSTFQVQHNLTMSGLQPSGYRFGSTVVGDMISPTDPAYLLVGDTDPNGNVNAQGFYNINEAIKCKWAAQIMNNKFQSVQNTVDYRGPSFTLSGCLVNADIPNLTGVSVLQYLQTITPKITVGAEMMHQRSPQIPEGSMSLFTASAKYSDELNCVSGFLGQAGAGLYLYRRFNEDLQFGVEVEKLRDEFVASVGYQYDIPKANFSMRGMIDNNWTVTGMFEKRLLPMPCSFSLCASINHTKNQFRLGCGLNVEL